MRPSETDQKLRKQRLIFYEDDVERINKALEKGYTDYHNLKVDPALEKIRDDSRFTDLMQSR